jgi:hypothetical protein
MTTPGYQAAIDQARASVNDRLDQLIESYQAVQARSGSDACYGGLFIMLCGLPPETVADLLAMAVSRLAAITTMKEENHD